MDYPKGDPRNPLTDREVEEKFDALAEASLSKDARARVKDAVWKTEKLASITELMDLLRAGEPLLSIEGDKAGRVAPGGDQIRHSATP